MSTTDRTVAGEPTDASDVAGVCRGAELLHFVVRADGDALVATGTLVAACAAAGTPYHVSVVRTRTELEERITATDEATPLVVGAHHAGTRSLSGPSPVSRLAYDAALELGADPNPALALAGVMAAGRDPEAVAPELLERAGISRAAGVAIPTRDIADGLAHSTLVHTAFSGDPEAAGSAVSDLGPSPEGRAIASLVALACVEAPATPRAAEAVERALRPLVGGPFETIGGAADVIDALANRAPGLVIALFLGADVTEEALDRWRDHAGAAHEAVRNAETARHDGLVVARIDGPDVPVEAVARLLWGYRSPEPAVVALADGEAGLATSGGSAGDAVETAATAAAGSGLGSGMTGFAAFDPDRTDAFVEALREAL